jgi:hypothetical protein
MTFTSRKISGITWQISYNISMLTLKGGVSMPQLSVYLDDNTLAQVEENAKVRNISVSNLIANVLEKFVSNQWPEGFENLFGSVSDETFQRQPDNPFSSDVKRETF